MKRSLLTLIGLFFCTIIFSQNGFADWDKSYVAKSAEKIIQEELEYAKKVEKDTSQNHYYVGLGKYRFLAKFTGKKRAVDKEVKASMKRVFKLRVGNENMLDELVKEEYQFVVGKTTLWMPIQNQIIKYFDKEVKANTEVLIYALFTNEHTYKGEIINAFLISEFTKEWKD